MTYLAIALGLFVLALVIFAIDLMIPSGGVLVAVTACIAFAAIVFAFRYSVMAGMWMVAATFAAIPVLFWAFIEIWPRTPFGKRMIVEPERAGRFVWSDASVSDEQTLVGAIGITVDELLPSGYVKIENKSFEAVSETGPIDQGKTVRVMRLDLGRLVVMEVREVQANTTKSDGTGLDRPADELDIESLEG